MAENLAVGVGMLCRRSGAEGDAAGWLVLEALPDGRLSAVKVDKNAPDRAVTVPAQTFLPNELTAVCPLPDAANLLAMRRRAQAAFEAFEARRRETAAGVSASCSDESADEAAPVETAMIFCAGLGTRLRPLTNLFPKPAVPFFGPPLIRAAMGALRKSGIRHLVINTHHLPEVMEATARKEASRAGFESFRVSHEPVLMDTAGGLRDARRLMETAGGSGAVLVVNGDALLAIDLREFLRRHRRSGAAASLAVAPPVPGAGFRAIEADEAGAIVRIRGIGPEKDGLTPWHFLGAHVVTEEVFRAIPADGPRDINGEVYPAMIRAGCLVQALPVPIGAWADLGTPRRYYGACMELLSGFADLTCLGEGAPLQWGRVAKGEGEFGAWRPSFIGESAEVESGAFLDASVIQDGARVGRCARVIRSVLLPGASVPPGASVEDAILWQGGSMSTRG